MSEQIDKQEQQIKALFPKGFFDARVDKDGYVDLGTNEVQIATRLVNGPFIDELMTVYKVEGEDFVCLNFDDGAENAEIRFTREMAEKLVSPFGAPEQADEITLLRATVDACRAAGFIDGEGKVRKVLGTLPITADGCVMGECTTVYAHCGGGYIGECDTGKSIALLKDADGQEAIVPREECFATEAEAAEAARREGGAD